MCKETLSFPTVQDNPSKQTQIHTHDCSSPKSDNEIRNNSPFGPALFCQENSRLTHLSLRRKPASLQTPCARGRRVAVQRTLHFHDTGWLSCTTQMSKSKGYDEYLFCWAQLYSTLSPNPDRTSVGWSRCATRCFNDELRTKIVVD